ncbi:hypothetical protein AALO_G00158610 [Alosa alosa]|uniref:Uncharacterized protein n=1 Tax=Alosa alosa TaxID=278164 RepID=A0AAV6GJS0_9TELE|nr:hypothetical protein AALO_G00158610 [Alosa alosa]
MGRVSVSEHSAHICKLKDVPFSCREWRREGGGHAARARPSPIPPSSAALWETPAAIISFGKMADHRFSFSSVRYQGAVMQCQSTKRTWGQRWRLHIHNQVIIFVFAGKIIKCLQSNAPLATAVSLLSMLLGGRLGF